MESARKKAYFQKNEMLFSEIHNNFTKYLDMIVEMFLGYSCRIECSTLHECSVSVYGTYIKLRVDEGAFTMQCILQEDVL